MSKLARNRAMTTEVLIVGAGPVGTILALELAHHGVRSMELLRRLGLHAEIRARGVAPEHPFNFIWSRNFDEPPIAIWHYASVLDMQARTASANDGSAPVEAHQRLQGSLLEEILRSRVRSSCHVELREGCLFVDLDQDLEGVSVRTIDTASGESREIRARFVVGCDGANSAVRRRAGLSVDQSAPSTRHRDIYFRSKDPVLRRHGRAFLTIAAGGLTLVSRDEDERWTGSVHLASESARDRDPVELMWQCLGVDFQVDEVLNVVEWQGRLGIAEHYRCGSTFLAGDSAHQFYPTGGHGANTGIGDAIDLGWKLAAYIGGWASADLLESYEVERRPVALFNREMCWNLLEVWQRFSRLVDGQVTREHLAGFLDKERYQMDNLGLHFDYRYHESPIVWHGEALVPSPRWEWAELNRTVWPGCRAPAVRLRSGEQLLDHFGRGFTLVDLSDGESGKEMAASAARRGIPITYVALADDRAASVWARRFVLVRPDEHIAWCGDEIPSDIGAVLDRVTGFDEQALLSAWH